MVRTEDIESLASDFRDAIGRPLLSVNDSAKVLGCHPNTVRRAIWAGHVRASRRAANGPLQIRATELARWVCDGEALSKPR